jgi:uncharacterized membrane protein (UPF0182 family)
MIPVILLLVLIAMSRSIASLAIDYEWWKEIGQVQTWINLGVYGTAPILTAAVMAGITIWIAMARGLKVAGEGFGSMPRLIRLATVGALVLGFFIASSTIESWDTVRFIAGRAGGGQNAAVWHDPIFGRPLGFYLFELPFYRAVVNFILTTLVFAGIAFFLSSRGNAIRAQIAPLRAGGELDLRALRFSSGLDAPFLRVAGVLFLLTLALRAWLGRFALLYSDHGFMTGIDYVDENFRIPLLWVFIGACFVAAVFVLRSQWKFLWLLPVVWGAQVVAPGVAHTLYVRPNEINLEKPYIANHIQATRSAYGLGSRLKEREYDAKLDTRMDLAKHGPLLDNVRLWDWQAFHDTVTQIQALRPYYVFADTDVDRYVIDGKLRQVLVTPRELDIDQLPDARSRWINPHFIYTHGYGVAVAEANRITADGLPHLLVKDAPPVTQTESLRLTRPELYYGEKVHEPVFVRTGQKEFSYPSGNDSVFTRYDGTGGFPIDSFLLRLAAAVRDADVNVLLTGVFTPDSRMMIRRNVLARVREVAGFLHWDSDPYLVITDDGRLVWTVDGYAVSDSHPYSHPVEVEGERCNYMRNSVKATVDAYHGTIHLYVFDQSDPLVTAYQRLFPGLFEPASAMPADLRQHVRYPELFFRVQAEIYRLYHMRDPQAFYNKEDVWDLPRNANARRNQEATDFKPTYLVAVLPGQQKPEFILMMPFTPRNKDNLIGTMIARCDGEHLGEMEVLQLSKQALIFGPRQMDARIDQDPEISKDLSLWNQKGSEVIRGQMIVLPVDKTFLYVEPIYIQSSGARMPQLKKVVIATGNDLIYRNTYEEAIAALAKSEGPAPVAETGPPPPGASTGTDLGGRLNDIRDRLRRYRELWSQGKYADAGRELEQIEALAGRPH